MLQPKQPMRQLASIGFNQGLREPPLLCHINSLDFARSVPWDFIHMIMENIYPLLVDHWTGKFRSIEVETAKAVRSIPAAFVCVLPNIAKDQSALTAELWCFWFLYLALTLLNGQF
jgi:hypothetical protein